MASALLAGLSQAAVLSPIVHNGAANGGGGGGTFVGVATNPDGSATYSYSYIVNGGDTVTFDIIVSQFTGSSWTAAGGVVHGTQVATGLQPSHLFSGNSAALGDGSIQVEFDNLVFDNSFSGFNNLPLSFDGFVGVTESTTGGDGALVAHSDSTVLSDIPDGAAIAFSTSYNTYDIFVGAGFPGVYRNRNLALEITHSDDLVVVPEPSSAALLGLGGLALIARRRRS